MQGGGALWDHSYNNIMLIRACAVCYFIWIGFVITHFITQVIFNLTISQGSRG